MISEMILHLAGKTLKFNRVGEGFDIYEQNQDGWLLIETAPSIDALDTFIKLIRLDLKFYPAN
jgi:hypothetical protein